jgi:hypothetical protein
MRSTSTQLCGQPRRWITSAGLSPVALAPTGGHRMTPGYYTEMSLFCSDFGVGSAETYPRGVLIGGALHDKI